MVAILQIITHCDILLIRYETTKKRILIGEVDINNVDGNQLHQMQFLIV